MSEEITTAGGSGAAAGGQTDVAGGDTQDSPNQEKAFQKILSELKAERAKRREMESKYQAVEAEKLQEQGKWKELWESEKKKSTTLEDQYKKATAEYAYSTVKGQIEREASKLGCIDSDLLIKTVELDQVEIDEKYNVNTESVKKMLEGIRKTKPYLFKQDGASVRDTTPANGAAVSGTDFNKMSTKELKEFARKAGII